MYKYVFCFAISILNKWIPYIWFASSFDGKRDNDNDDDDDDDDDYHNGDIQGQQELWQFNSPRRKFYVLIFNSDTHPATTWQTRSP